MSNRRFAACLFCALSLTSSLVAMTGIAHADDDARAQPIVTAAPQKTPPVAPDADCALEHYLGIEFDDAIAIEEVVCSEVHTHGKPNQHVRLRISKLGSQLIIRLSADHTDRRLVISNVDEIAVAAPRLVDAVLDNTAIADTQDVDNVVGGEVRKSKSKISRVNANLGVVGVGTTAATPSAGLMLSIEAGDALWSFVTDVRLTGDALMDTAGVAAEICSLGIIKPTDSAASSFGSLSAGVRHHFGNGNNAVFAGMGIGLDHLAIRNDDGTQLKNTGLGSYVEAGFDVLRSSTIGGTVSLRLDAPFFAMKGSKADPTSTATATATSSITAPAEDAAPAATHSLSAWAPVAEVAFAMHF